MNFDVLTAPLDWQMKSVRLLKIVMYCLEDGCWILIKAQGLGCVRFTDVPALFSMGLCFMGRHVCRLPATSHISSGQSVLKMCLNPSCLCIPPVNCSCVIYGIGLLPARCVCLVGCRAITVPSL